jgi:hypothetical protein
LQTGLTQQVARRNEVRLKSMSGAGWPTMVETVDASLRRDGRGIEVETVARKEVSA